MSDVVKYSKATCLGGDHKQNEPWVVIQALCRESQQLPAQLDLVAPA